MGKWLLSRRDKLIVARHEVPGLELGRFREQNSLHGPEELGFRWQRDLQAQRDLPRRG
jgi:hypothetical protein